jgi:transposase
MTRRKPTNNNTRRRHSLTFKEEALSLTETVVVREAADQLGLHELQLYDWRRKLKSQSDKSQIERDQVAEIAKLKRQLAEQAEELAIVKKAATTSKMSVTQEATLSSP